MTHQCSCGKIYNCLLCHTKDSYICPTLNNDEDGNLCDDCLTKAASALQAALDEIFLPTGDDDGESWE